MSRSFISACIAISITSVVWGQDSLDNIRLSQMIDLSEVVIRTDLNVPRFVDRVKNDSSFYKAFRNLRVLGFTSLNDIRIRDKKGETKASLQSKTRQIRKDGCRTMEVLSETSTGDMYNEDHQLNFQTADLYAGLFFTQGKICGETNVVKGVDFNPRELSGLAKHKAQLKMLFFNPGKKIPGIPFIGEKIDIFDPARAVNYDWSIELGDHEGESCYIFSNKVKSDLKRSDRNDMVIDSMTTWFNAKTMEIIARTYDMSYDAGVYDFNVHMEVQMTRFGDLIVPRLLRYIGNWDVMFRKRERGVFTTTIFDFRKEE